MRRRIMRIVLLLQLLVLAPHVLAAPSVGYSPANDGVLAGPFEVPLAGVADLDLWLDPEEPAFDFIVSFAADAGMELLSFDPEPWPGADEQFTPGDGGTLAFFGGDSRNLATGALRIGRLSVRGSGLAAELRLEPLPGVAPPSFVDADFDDVLIPTPQLIARVTVPEPWRTLSLALALLPLAIGLRRAR